ncbi:MAG TPA: DUF4232 domain-containing protein [Trebonia sp.]|nr:DUF4232 domain-containing protein [Trebonia sp.]
MIKPSRRGVAAAAAVLAVGAGSATWAATSASAAPARPAANAAAAYIPRCTPADLAVWVNTASASGTAGTTYYHLEYTNISGATCHLYSWPGVSAVDSAGKQLGPAAVRDGSAPAVYVNIAPGGTAHSVLGYVDAAVSAGCDPATSAELKVYPPDDSAARYAFFTRSVCSTGTVPDLTVWRVQPGV